MSQSLVGRSCDLPAYSARFRRFFAIRSIQLRKVASTSNLPRVERVASGHPFLAGDTIQTQVRAIQPFEQYLITAYFPSSASVSLRVSRPIALTIFRKVVATPLRPPCRQFGFAGPGLAPPPAPCIRHTRQPRTAGPWQSAPVLLDVALQRGAALKWLTELILCPPF